MNEEAKRVEESMIPIGTGDQIENAYSYDLTVRDCETVNWRIFGDGLENLTGLWNSNHHVCRCHCSNCHYILFC